MAGLVLRQGRRTGVQRFFLDPLVGILAAVLIGLFKILPIKMALKIGGAFGGLGYIFCRRRNQIADRNLQIAFPDMSPKRRQEIRRRMWYNFGRVFIAMTRPQAILTVVKIKDKERFQVLKANPKGGFIISAHLGNWEVAGGLLQQIGVTMNPVYRPANNPWLEKLLFQKRKGLKIPKGLGGSRLILQTLQQKKYVGMLCDQKLNEGIAVPFFGKPAMTAPAVAHLALKYNVPIYPAFGIWTRQGVVAHFLDPLPFPKSGTMDEKVQQMMKQINALFEEWITRYPDQWLWMHRRFDKKEYR